MYARNYSHLAEDVKFDGSNKITYTLFVAILCRVKASDLMILEVIMQLKWYHFKARLNIIKKMPTYLACGPAFDVWFP